MVHDRSTEESRFKVVIPARYQSTRLPGKPLRFIAGKSMIAHVCDRALESNAEEVVVATDDDRIYQTAIKCGVQACMTRADHSSGTDRLAEVAAKFGWDSSTLVVNLQGDEPLLAPELIRCVAYALAGQSRADVATLATPILESNEVFDANAVKVVCDKDSYALYFSRAPVPWDREAFGKDLDEMPSTMSYLRHIGIYAYTVEFLQRYVKWPNSILESVESLEQLRILWNGEKILVKCVANAPEAGVDTEEDLSRVEQFILNSVVGGTE